MKRILAILLTMVMLVVSVPAFAADTAVQVTSKGWTYSGWDLNANTSHSYYVSDDTYDGAGSMHLVLNSDDDSTTNDRFVIRVNSANNASAMQLMANTTYELTMYVKVVKNEEKTGNAGSEAIEVRLNSTSKLSEHLQADDDGDGWQLYKKVETIGDTVTDSRVGFWIGNGDADVYFDNIKVVPTATTNTANTQTIGQNILSTEMSCLDDGTPKVEEPQLELSSTADETVDVTTLGWTAPNWSSTGDAEKEWHKVSPSVSYKGSGSMHLQYVTDGVTTSNDRFAIRSDNHYLDGSSQYKLTMYVKVLINTLKDTSTTVYTAMATLGDSGNIYLTQDNPLMQNTEKDGWQKLETTVTSNATTNRLEISLGQGTADLYIDCISIQKINADGSLGDNIFTDEMMYNFDTDSSFDPDTSDEDANIDNWDYDWVYSCWGVENAKQISHMISPSVSYKGSGSLHMVYETDGISGNDRFAIRQQNFLTSGKTYKLSFYAKILHNGPQDEGTDDTAYVYAYDKGNVSLNNTDYYVGEPDNGWQKIEIEFTATAAALDFYMQRGKADVYIDCVSCKLVENGTETEMLSDKQRNFDDDTPSDVVAVPVTDRPENVPDLTADTNIKNYDWEVSAFNSGNGTVADSEAYTADVTSEVAYEGKNSLHITFEQDDVTSYIVVRPLAEKNTMKANSTYKVTLYIRPVVNTANGIQAYFAAYTDIDTLGKAKYFTKADKEGWYKYEATSTCSTVTRVQIGANAGKCEFYLDNISVYEVDGDGNVGTTNLYDGVMGTFETAADASYTVTEAKLFDAEGNAVTDITAAESGKTITAAAAVANYTETDTFSGQLIVCVYKNNVLENINYSESKVIAATDGAKTLTADIELPAITAADANEYTVRVFVWEAVDTMVPLSLSTVF